MLKLNGITKTYLTGNTEVEALKGVSLEFRRSEFVSILGPSGCGKTTLLNIIGGLDRYTLGDLIINDKSTKTFKDADWDAYRNHSIGFVFQSYNLIPHQTVLENVELALTLSGVSKSERSKRAKEALESVGLGDQLDKKPTQLSGGQMQRVAIARALVNNPDILLADEPTGALDTKTSVQIMDILKEVAKDRLVIMVTHNPELAEEYSTRIVKLSDGLVVSDSNPYFADNDSRPQMTAVAPRKEKKPRMSFFTALSLSLKNLMTKKGRTAMTSFAGSIGIIGIALILALSNGIQLFINQVQEDTLSTYPISIMKETQDINAMLSAMTNVNDVAAGERDPNMIYVDDSLGTMMQAMTSTKSNNLVAFKKYLDSHMDELEPYVSDIQYTYDIELQVYTSDGKTKLGMLEMLKSMGEDLGSLGSLMTTMGSAGAMNIMSEMIDNQELLDQQYELVDGHWPENEKEVVLVVSRDNQISKMALYMLGILDHSELEDIMEDLLVNGKYDTTPIDPYPIDYFLDMSFYLLNTYDFYRTTDKTYTNADGEELPVWEDLRERVDYVSDPSKLASHVRSKGTKLKISGIIRPKVDATASSISGLIGYTKGLTDMLLDNNAQSSIIAQQKANPEYNVLTGLKFERTRYTPDTIHQLVDKIDDATMEQFYELMTKRILEDPNFSARLDVTDAESFMQIFFMMPQDMQSEIVSQMLSMSLQKDPIGVNGLCGVISSMMQNVTVTPDNLLKLYPVMDMYSIAVILGGVPDMQINGLIGLVGEQDMMTIYKATSDALKQLTVTEEIFKAILTTLDPEGKDFATIEETLYQFAPQTDATLESNLKLLGDAEEASPASVNFYAKDFQSKEYIESFIKDYNNSVEEKDKLDYSDIVGALMSSVSTIIDVISYVLIAFVAISLVVSSIMIGIITNISVLERTKEIGILRAIGASKKDISRVFNAETFIIGLFAGVLGIAITLLLCLPTNAIIQALSGFSNVKAVLPALAAGILVVISMLLTIVAGLIPSRSAANKDPVVALRSE